MSVKVKKRRKKKQNSAWGEFKLIELDAEQEKLVDGEIWVNNLYQVRIAKHETPFGEMTQLSIKRRDKSVIRDWRHLQRIKNELVGLYVEGVELFPTEDRLVNTENYNLWCLPEGQIFPFGFSSRLVVEESTETTKQWPDDLSTDEQAQVGAKQLLEERVSDTA